MKQQREQVFISYSHKDKEWLEKLTTMLKPLVRNQTINVWDDTKIKAGSQWKDEIKKALAAAKIAVLIVSPNFLASDFIAEHELPPLLQVAEQEGLTIIWVYVSSCLYNETEIGNYQAAHDISHPLKGLSEAELDDVLVDICQKIKDLIRERKPLIPNRENSSAQSKDIHLTRPNVELSCYQKIMKPGAVIRIKGYWHIGKTSVLQNILHTAKENGYLTIYLGFRGSISPDSFTNPDGFFKWFCDQITRSLYKELKKEINTEDLSSNIERYWKNPYSNYKNKSTDYFQENLLSQISQPLVLGLDDVTVLYKNPRIADEFFELLRGWSEEAKGYNNNNWRKLRLILAYAKEFEMVENSDIYLSPFNTGLTIDSKELEFTPEQVLELANLHNLNYSNHQIEQLINLVGGHPFLIKMALSKISHQDISLKEFLDNPSQVAEIREHLQYLWGLLQTKTDLKQIMSNIIYKTDLGNLDTTLVESLESMGLIKKLNGSFIPNCNLYLEYFKSLLS
jgi:hypothetical protein